MVLVATWHDGLFVLDGATLVQELRNQSVRALAPGAGGSTLAIANGRSLQRRAPDGVWSAIATTQLDLACCMAVGDVMYVGTDDARVLRVGKDGALEQLRGFDAVAGRETWYAGSAVINGRRLGPPLGIRSIAATPDGVVLFANVHVGGVPRSTDGGATWQPTIHVESDVHEVRAHPNRPGVVMAAAATGLFSSRDGGVTWDVEQEGLHASYCSAVAFAGDDVFVSASADHFAAQGAVYRRRARCAGRRRRRPARVDRWHRRHRLHRHGRLDSRARRSKGQPLSVRRHRPQLVAPGQWHPIPEQRPHRLSTIRPHRPSGRPSIRHLRSRPGVFWGGPHGSRDQVP